MVVVKTVSTTQMINRLAAKHGLEVCETPVGFNYIADYMLKDDVLIGGEESGGISFRGHIPEGDGGPEKGAVVDGCERRRGDQQNEERYQGCLGHGEEPPFGDTLRRRKHNF